MKTGLGIEVLLVQLLVLAFTGALWWLARRDLASRPPPAPLPVEAQADMQELEQLCGTLETLVTTLAGRLEVAEGQIARLRMGNETRPLVPAAPPMNLPNREDVAAAFAAPTLGAGLPPPEPGTGGMDPRHAPLYALLDEGLTDPAELVRRTGLGRGEVDLILSLRGRRAL